MSEKLDYTVGDRVGYLGRDNRFIGATGYVEDIVFDETVKVAWSSGIICRHWPDQLLFLSRGEAEDNIESIW